MAKKSRKRSKRPKKDNAGCMSGLISLFDFRQGRFTQKLLPDKKHESRRHGGTVHSGNKFEVLGNLEEKHQDVSDTDTKERERDNSAKASIKVLMAEEMSKARTSKKIPSSTVEQIKAELGIGDGLEINYARRQKQNYNIGSDHDVSDLRSSQSIGLDPSERSSFDVNLAELMIEFCRKNHECREKHNEINSGRNSTYLSEHDAQLAQKHCILQRALTDITDALLARNSVDSEQVASHAAVQPKEFMDALETLNSNKDIFLKLLQDPNSLLFKHVLELQNAQAHEMLHGSKPEELVSCQPSQKENKHYFFKKKDRSDEPKIPDEGSSQGLKRIVVLKPAPARYEYSSNTSSPISSPRLLPDLQHQEGTERTSSHFSLKELKRRLRNMVGDSKKKRDLIAMDGVLHKIPYGCQNLDGNSKTSSNTQQTSKLSVLLKRGDNNAKQPQKKVNKPTVGDPLDREAVIYEEAKKRLAEMLNFDGQSGVSSPRHFSKSLGRILSLPGYNSSSPGLSPGREKEVGSPLHVRPSPLQNSKLDDSIYGGLSKQNIESSSYSDKNLDVDRQTINSSQTHHEPQWDIREELIQKGNTEPEVCGSLDIQLEFSRDEVGCCSDICIDEGPHMISDSVPSDDVQPLTPSVSISHKSMLPQKLEAPESNADNLDRHSPVSVLEPFFSEDVHSPERTEADKAELPAEPRQLTFEECGDSQLILTLKFSEANLRTSINIDDVKLKFVRSVLEASGLHNNRHLERWRLSDQLLDSFVFDEVEITYGQLIDDSKLLFDCINEVLVEIRDRYLICSPWMSFILPNIRPTPTGENFVREAGKGVGRHLQTVSPYTLDRVMRKDLESGTWMNLRLEAEGAVFEIGEVILEYIMEETILELWE